MKKITTLFMLGLMAGGSLVARTLTPDEALARLNSEQSNAPARLKGLSAANALKLSNTTFTEDGAAAVYLFDRADGGYLLVSADDNGMPLLGYADEGSVEGREMPPQMQWWLSQYAAEIQQAEGSDQLPLLTPLDAPQKITRPDRAPIAPLLKTYWDQSTPYNNFCPMLGKERTVTGCVATAMAQVMKYFNYPEQATGTGRITVNGSNASSLSLSSIPLDWDNMLDSYTGSYTTAQGDAVANLMKACGYAVGMNYNVASTGGSGAAGTSVAPALINNFGYDQGTNYYKRDYYGLAEWENMIYENLRNVGPVYYDGVAVEGGHAFVCDGYSSDGYFHFNWGWSGAYNGYFLLTALNPEGQGIGGFAGGYNESQGIVLGACKPTGQSATRTSRLSYINGYDLTATVSRGDLTLGGFWANLNPYSISVQIGLSFTDTKTGTVSYMQLYGNSPIDTNKGFSSMTGSLSGARLTSGVTYKVELVTRTASNVAWEPALYPLGMPGYILLTRSGDAYTVNVPTSGYLTVESATLDTPVYKDMAAKMTATFTNRTEGELMELIAPVLYSGSSVMAMADPLVIDLEAGESETREITFTFNRFNSSIKEGNTYNLGLLDTTDGRLLANLGQITFNASTTVSMSISDFSIEGGTTVTDPSNIVFDATVRLNSGYFAGSVYAVVVDNLANSNVITFASSPTLFMEGGGTASTQIKLDFSAAQIGKTYYAMLCSMSGNTFNVLGYKTVSFTVIGSGIEETSVGIADEELPVEYYSLQGIRVMHPEKGRIYIRRQGDNVSKILF